MGKGKKKKAALLDPVIDLVAKSDHNPYGVVEGVNADALDVAQTASRANLLIKKALQNKKVKELLKKAGTDGPAPTIPLRQQPTVRVTVKRDPATQARSTASLSTNQIPKGQTLKNASKALKALKAVAKRNPIVSPAVMAYETAAIITSEKARMKAINQAEDMLKRSEAGGSASERAKNMAKNGLQGFLDPVGTIYAAGDGLADLAKTTVGNYFTDTSEIDDKIETLVAAKAAQEAALNAGLSDDEQRALRRHARRNKLREFGDIRTPEEARAMYDTVLGNRM